MSSSVLYERLGELTDAGLVARDGDGDYLLTGLGMSLSSALEPLGAWAARWAQSQVADGEQEPADARAREEFGQDAAAANM